MSRRYGQHPAHLLGHLAFFGLAGYAIAQILGLPGASGVVLWLVGAVLFHDAFLWPLYTGADQAGQRILRGASINYLRVPAGLSLVLGLAFIATITEKGEGAYERVSGLAWSGHLTRWLLVSAALFAVSGVVFLVRRYGSRT